jgi:hypothetical protein
VYLYILRCEKKNGVVAPIIEAKVLDQVREESYLDVVEGNEKKALDTDF